MWRFISGFKIVDLVLLLWIVLWIVPQSALLPFYNYIWLSFYAFWFLIILFNFKSLAKNEKSFFVLYVSCFGLIIFETLIAGKIDLLHNMVELSQMPFMYFIFCYYWRNNLTTRLKNIIIVSVPLFVVFSITTIMALIINPFAARMIYITGERLEDSQDALIMGVGGYLFIYATLLFAIVLFYLFFSIKKPKSLRIIIILLFFFFSFLILFSNFFTALVILLFSTGVFLLLRKKQLILPIIFLFIVIAPFYKTVGVGVIDGLSFFASEEGRTYERLQELKVSLITGKQVDEDVNTREDVKKMSIDAFIENPITGAVLSTEMSDKMIGNHSTFLDAFARFGFLIGGFFILLLFMPFKYLLSEANTYKQKTYIISYALTILVLMINNNLPVPGAYVSYIIFPASFMLIKKSLYNNYSNAK